jgi:hypothetical protein
MAADARTILQQLSLVEQERERRAADPELAAAVGAVKAYQQQRFRHTYADLLASERYAAAARFFLDELYGPRDFSERDAQFARVVPAMVRLFPQEIVATVDTLARLHALSESLDTQMADRMRAAAVDAMRYVAAWQRTADLPTRERQIELTLAIGSTLDRLTRKPLLRRTLHLMRGPARAAGLSALQQFLEAGFDTFAAMRGAGDFLGTVEQRERALAVALFAARLDTDAATSDTSMHEALGQLP